MCVLLVYKLGGVDTRRKWGAVRVIPPRPPSLFGFRIPFRNRKRGGLACSKLPAAGARPCVLRLKLEECRLLSTEHALALLPPRLHSNSTEKRAAAVCTGEPTTFLFSRPSLAPVRFVPLHNDAVFFFFLYCSTPRRRRTRPPASTSVSSRPRWPSSRGGAGWMGGISLCRRNRGCRKCGSEMTRVALHDLSGLSYL